jgi:hypothetical protein
MRHQEVTVSELVKIAIEIKRLASEVQLCRLGLTPPEPKLASEHNAND